MEVCTMSYSLLVVIGRIIYLLSVKTFLPRPKGKSPKGSGHKNICSVYEKHKIGYD